MWVEKQQALAQVAAKLSENSSPLRVLTDEMTSQVKGERAQSRKEKHNLKYKVLKYQKKFQTCGATAEMAKLGSELLFWHGVTQDKGQLDGRVVKAQGWEASREIDWGSAHSVLLENYRLKEVFTAVLEH